MENERKRKSSQRAATCGRGGASLHFFFLFVAIFSSLKSHGESPLPATLDLKTAAVRPHDKAAFTQGLVFRDGFLYESTGEYGKSTLRKVEPETGKVVMRVTLPERFFAEGLEIVGDRIYQLTWREGHCFVYDKATFALVEQFRYPGEGWGLAFDGEHLILSDGSATLRFLDPKTFRQKRVLRVTDRDARTNKPFPVKNLNELEFVHGELWANVWLSTRIARINPENGRILGWLDCAGFVPEEFRSEISGPPAVRHHVLNGIAFDAEKNLIYLTGKNWPVLYEIKLVSAPK